MKGIILDIQGPEFRYTACAAVPAWGAWLKLALTGLSLALAGLAFVVLALAGAWLASGLALALAIWSEWSSLTLIRQLRTGRGVTPKPVVFFALRYGFEVAL